MIRVGDEVVTTKKGERIPAIGGVRMRGRVVEVLGKKELGTLLYIVDFGNRNMLAMAGDEVSRVPTRVKKKNPAEKNPRYTYPAGSVLNAIRAGDRVTIRDRFGKERTGKAVMSGPHGWVLNMGGAHGTPGIATDENITKVKPGKAPRENPDLLVLTNPPPRGELMGKRVYKIEYQHAKDGKNYFHDFGSDVRMEALPDGSVRIYSTKGRPVWGEY